jgi:hypothetical protein
MQSVRIPAYVKHEIEFTPNTRMEHVYPKLPEHVKWPGDNFNNLMYVSTSFGADSVVINKFLRQQPTQFYALALTMVALGDRSTSSARWAWAYVGLRILHSVVHSTVNIPSARGGAVSASHTSIS